MLTLACWGDTMPLLLAETGTSYTIVRICGCEKIKHYLESLGFIAGTAIVVVSKFNDYFLVNVKGSRIGIGREMAKRVIIR